MKRLYFCSALTSLLFFGVISTGNLLPQTGKGPRKSTDQHDPSNAVANLDIHPGLEVKLFASEAKLPHADQLQGALRTHTLTNPTNIDIDARGRVWVCDVKNYRGNNGRRPEGDRIIILEDTNGDGIADKAKVFYQGRDVDSAMGICVLGNKVIVSSSPNVLVFTFDEATDKILKKEVLFSKTGQPQHDHSAHTFVFGPDGRLYWNFGNTGQSVHDKKGNLIVDVDGHGVVDNGRPYFGGMVFRCNPDGSDFEVLAHNFRNNYAVAVDSFGTLWQSDNDDDGNRGVRINYVMEYGNYGYRDEMTGAGWNSPRTNLEPDVPSRHWHQNDPGVVPNLLQTGGGSPTGITVYEAKLLPKVFHNQVIHCDAGPSIVRAYPVQNQGAGYKAEIVNILDGSKKNNWFRPVDPRVGPDGSLFVSDWYDPGVGGHAQRDLDRGRIFWVAVPGHKYTVPKFDFSTAAGAVEALKSPCSSVRYLAWNALHQQGAAAEAELLKLWQASDPRYRARALWLLGRIPGKGQHYVQLALKDADADIRITGLRLARQLKLDLIPLIRQVVRDSSPQVRRDCAIALRHNTSPEAPALWAELALQHDGKDRWYLEALGIGADRQWDAFFDAWLSKVGHDEPNPAPYWDIIWRSRARKTPEYLARILSDPRVPSALLPRFLRAFDFQQGDGKQAALIKLVMVKPAEDPKRQGFIVLEALKRLKQVNLDAQPQLAATLDRLLTESKDPNAVIEIVSHLSLTKYYPRLLAIAQEYPDQQAGVNAVRALLEKRQQALLQRALQGKDAKLALATVQALATASDDRSVPLLLPLLRDSKRDIEQRRQAVRALAKTRNGAQALLQMARSKEIADELTHAAGAALSTASWKEIKSEASKLFPLPAAKDNKPLPAFSQLVQMRGDPNRGKIVFRTTGTCASCHIVNGEGKDVGPDLSEIGKKLSRESMLESILFPSAGISHNYETYVVALKSGGIESGLLASDTPEAVTLKGADGILRTFKRADIDQLQKSPISLMPADLQKQLTAQDLADVVDYLLTLRQAQVRPQLKTPGR
jgi:putative membrane-bound dehydrogenase-like protein